MKFLKRILNKLRRLFIVIEQVEVIKEVKVIKEVPIKHENKGLYFEVYKGKNKKWYFRMKSANHKIIASTNQGYENKKDCMSTVTLIKDGAYSSSVSVKR